MADLVPYGARVADIGTDHGRLLVDVATRRGAPLAIGVDCRVDPLDEARRTIARTAGEASARIVLRRGDGLAPIADDEVDAIVIAGMGGDRIASILEADAGRVARRCLLVLQPTAHWTRLRAYLDGAGLITASESFVHDRGRDHLLLTARAAT